MLFKQRKNKYSWLLFSFNLTDPRDAAGPRTQLSQDKLAFGPRAREGKRLCGVEDETKTSWCSKSVWVQRCWYVKLKIERASSAGGFESVQACFCAQGCCLIVAVVEEAEPQL